MLQQELVAGDTLNFLTSTPGYSAADGWVLNFRLVPRTAGNAVLALSSTAEGESHRTQASAATTGSWAADNYSWSAWVARAGESFTLQRGEITVRPDPRTLAAGVDGRSLARKTVDDLLAARSEWARTQGRTRRYKIADREREFNTAAELDAELRFWTAQLQAEDTAARLASGLRPKNRILTRFVRPR